MSDSSEYHSPSLPIVGSVSVIPEEVAEPLDEKSGDSEALDTSLNLLPHKTPIRRDETYYIDFVEFLVEDCLFQVPKYQFTNQASSSYFWESLEPVAYYGSAIKIDDVQEVDFRALVKLLYPLHISCAAPLELTPEEWRSILKLSFKWQMHDIVERAMSALKQALPLIEQVLLARTYGVYDWLELTYTKLVQRDVYLSENEARILGLDNALKLVSIREKRYRQISPEYQPVRVSFSVQNIFSGPIARELEELEWKNDSGALPTAVQQLMLGRTYGLRQWVEGGYRALSQRSEPVTLDEGKILGLEITISLCNARDGVLRKKFVFDGTSRAVEVTDAFLEELNGLHEISEHYGKPRSPPQPAPETLTVRKKKGKLGK